LAPSNPDDRSVASSAHDVLARNGPIFAALVGLTALAVLLQGVFAGEFIERGTHHNWLDAHNVNAYVVIVLAVLSAVFALVRLRTVARSLAIGAVVLALLVLVQVAIGHEITQGDDDGLIPIHVPLALVIFGLTIWLSVRARTLRRTSRPGPSTQ
jgi:hypothetical protein